MSLFTRKIWSFLSPDGYVTKQDREILAVGYSRSVTSSISSFFDTVINVILGVFGFEGGPTHGIPNVVNAPYEEMKRQDYFVLSKIHIFDRSDVPEVKAEIINTINVSAEYIE